MTFRPYTVGLASVLAITASMAMADETSVVVGMQLEPPSP